MRWPALLRLPPTSPAESLSPRWAQASPLRGAQAPGPPQSRRRTGAVVARRLSEATGRAFCPWARGSGHRLLPDRPARPESRPSSPCPRPREARVHSPSRGPASLSDIAVRLSLLGILDPGQHGSPRPLSTLRPGPSGAAGLQCGRGPPAGPPPGSSQGPLDRCMLGAARGAQGPAPGAAWGRRAPLSTVQLLQGNLGSRGPSEVWARAPAGRRECSLRLCVCVSWAPATKVLWPPRALGRLCLALPTPPPRWPCLREIMAPDLASQGRRGPPPSKTCPPGPATHVLSDPFRSAPGQRPALVHTRSGGPARISHPIP